MKLRVLFLRKYHIFYIIVITMAAILFIANLTKESSSSTFNLTVNDSKAIKADFTGDGIEDILYINTEKDKYYIQVNVKEKSYYLEPGRKLNTSGYYYPHWPMKITLMDITRDKIPEIFVQSSQKGKAIQHIFVWDGSDFKDIFCSNNNILGFLDTQSNKTPRVVSGNFTSNNSNFLQYMFINSNLQSFSYNDDIMFGKDSIRGFINYIESLPEGEAYKPKDIFYPGLVGKDLIAIGKLCGENNIYTFQDALFTDSKIDKEGSLIEIKWILNFKGTSKVSPDQSKNYSISVKLKPDMNSSDHNFKIYNIVLN